MDLDREGLCGGEGLVKSVGIFRGGETVGMGHLSFGITEFRFHEAVYP